MFFKKKKNELDDRFWITISLDKANGKMYVNLGWPPGADSLEITSNFINGLLNGDINNDIINCLSTINDSRIQQIINNIKPNRFLNPLDM